MAQRVIVKSRRRLQHEANQFTVSGHLRPAIGISAKDPLLRLPAVKAVFTLGFNTLRSTGSPGQETPEPGAAASIAAE